jgi:uncharacterized phage infection (PIP) family protein YhgE
MDSYQYHLVFNVETKHATVGSFPSLDGFADTIGQSLPAELTFKDGNVGREWVVTSVLGVGSGGATLKELAHLKVENARLIESMDARITGLHDKITNLKGQLSSMNDLIKQERQATSDMADKVFEVFESYGFVKQRDQRISLLATAVEDLSVQANELLADADSVRSSTYHLNEEAATLYDGASTMLAETEDAVRLAEAIASNDA